MGSSTSLPPSCLLRSASLTRFSSSFSLRMTSRSPRIDWKSFYRGGRNISMLFFFFLFPPRKRGYDKTA